MIIKKFVAKTEEDATNAAKKELGSGFVVMNVRVIKNKGFFAFLKPKQVEVTVAMEEETEKFSTLTREIEKATQLAESRKSAKEESAHNENKEISDKLDSLQAMLENQMKLNATKSDTDEQVKKQTDEKKSSAESDPESETDDEQDDELLKFQKLLYNTMVDNEVDEKIANQIMEEIEKTNQPHMPFDYVLANVYQKMILKFGKAEEISKADNGPKLVTFIGPTGVGKTTTIAKIASQFTVKEKCKCALLTMDTYRIAAAEQLRTYANILMVPFRVIYSEEELKDAIEDFKDYDYIFVDTAGHSHQNLEQLNDMKKFLEAMSNLAATQFFLVLSATTKYRDLKNIVDNYAATSAYQLIFTKLDETSTIGNLLNIKLYCNSPIAFVTYGQNVPDDIEIFNPQTTVKQILGGKSSRELDAE